MNQLTQQEANLEKIKCRFIGCSKKSIIESKNGKQWCLKHYLWQRDGYFSKMRKIIWNNLLK